MRPCPICKGSFPSLEAVFSLSFPPPPPMPVNLLKDELIHICLGIKEKTYVWGSVINMKWMVYMQREHGQWWPSWPCKRSFFCSITISGFGQGKQDRVNNWSRYVTFLFALHPFLLGSIGTYVSVEAVSQGTLLPALGYHWLGKQLVQGKA